MSQRRRRPSARRPRGHLSGDGAGGAGGGAGAAAAAGQEAGPPAGTDETAAHRRDPVADPDGRAVAGRAPGLRAVADGLWPVPPLAAERDLAEDPDRPAVP